MGRMGEDSEKRRGKYWDDLGEKNNIVSTTSLAICQTTSTTIARTARVARVVDGSIRIIIKRSNNII